ncbi:alpha-keto acid decarboxylase family protein [Microbulbifer sp. ZKSA006]|uniref:alpha-keto acid decarboxylase family protein n=1 Tax=Microbulbifer sp. ZKSA006 TaxID=3243390 RepID=UPI004039BB84
MASLSEFILSRLSTIGIQHIFGIPGDYVLPFFETMVKDESPVTHIGTCNELNAAYLADGYARIKGLGVVAATYGPGAFNTVNAVAGAFSEQVPLLILVGAPKEIDLNSRKLLHHAVGTDFDASLRVFAPITVSSVRLREGDPLIEVIDSSIKTALTELRPVYLEIPFNLQTRQLTDISPWHYSPPSSDPKQLIRALDHITQALHNANNPCALAGTLIDRNQQETIAEIFLASTRIPFVTTFDAKAGYLEYLPNCIGFYQGCMSEKSVRDKVENADLLLNLGMPLTEFNTGVFSAKISPESTIALNQDSVSVFTKEFPNVYFRDLLPALVERVAEVGFQMPERSYADTFPFTYTKSLKIERKLPITINSLYQQLAHFINDNDIITGNTGGYINLTRMRLHKGNTTAGLGNWASLGSAFPAAAGMAIANPERRVICIDGDGSFQMTGQELSTLVRFKIKLLLIILNNAEYGCERAIHPGIKDPYNDIQPWNYHLLPEAFGGNKALNGYEVRTEKDLGDALKAFSRFDGPLILNVHLEQSEPAAFFKKLSQAMRH